MTDSHHIDINTVVSRLEALFQKRRELDAQRERGRGIQSANLGDVDLEEMLKPRLTLALEQPRDAINYMVWLIGETLHACGGMSLLRKVEEGFYAGKDREFQVRAAFLNARWDGIGSWHA